MRKLVWGCQQEIPEFAWPHSPQKTLTWCLTALKRHLEHLWMYSWCRKCYWAISIKDLKLLSCRWLSFLRKMCGQTVYTVVFGHWSAHSGMGMLHTCKTGSWKLSFQRLELPEAPLESGGGTLGWCFRPCSCWTRIQITRAARVCGNVKSVSIRISSTRQIGADRHWMRSRHWPLSQLLQNREYLKLAFSQPEGKPMGKDTFKYILAEFRLNRDTFWLPKFN